MSNYLVYDPSSDTFVHPQEKKKLCNSPCKVLDDDDQEKQSNMSEKITAQLETISQTLTSVEAGYKI